MPDCLMTRTTSTILMRMLDPDQLSKDVAKSAEESALAALKRRRPDLRITSAAKVPAGESAQFELDRLAHTRAAADRLMDDVTALVLAARLDGASWLRVGLALNASSQTAMNRYSRFEQ